jgi:uncharacterized protein YheU (UPF0270 family)
MLIPYTQLSADTLDAILADFVANDTDESSAERTVSARKADLHKLLKQEQVFITRDEDADQHYLIAKAQVPAPALRAYRNFKNTLDALPNEELTQYDAGEPEPQVSSISRSPAADQPIGIKHSAGVGDTNTLTTAQLVEEYRQALPHAIPLGRTTMTIGVKVMLDDNKLSVEQLQDLLHRHSIGDFGVLGDDDKIKNFKAIPAQEYMLSRYCVNGIDLYVETGHGHQLTTVKLVNER